MEHPTGLPSVTFRAFERQLAAFAAAHADDRQYRLRPSDPEGYQFLSSMRHLGLLTSDGLATTQYVRLQQGRISLIDVLESTYGEAIERIEEGDVEALAGLGPSPASVRRFVSFVRGALRAEGRDPRVAERKRSPQSPSGSSSPSKERMMDTLAAAADAARRQGDIAQVERLANLFIRLCGDSA